MSRDFTHLPEPVRLEDTVAEHDAEPVAEADDVRNPDQHAALRDG